VANPEEIASIPPYTDVADIVETAIALTATVWQGGKAELVLAVAIVRPATRSL